MATSASKNVTCDTSGHYHLYMTITVNSQSVANNTSNVTVKMYAKSDSSSYGAYNLYPTQPTVQMTVNGTQVVNKTMAMDFRGMATVNMAEWTGTITHGTDGAKTLTCSGSFTIPGVSGLSGGSISLSVALDTIPRATTPTLSASSIAMGQALTITTTAAVSTWTHSLYYSIGSSTTLSTIATGVTASKAWTVPESIAASIPSATSVTVTITCKTYNGSTLIGSKTVSFTATVPASMVPTCTLAVSDGAGYAATYGGYLRGLSKAKVVVTAATVQGSAIASYKVTVGSSSYTGSTITSGVLSAAGTVTVKATVTDKRGRSGTASTTITVLAYSAPKVSALTVGRCDADGTANQLGEYCKVTFSGSITSLSGKNSAVWKLQYKKVSASTYTAVQLSTAAAPSGVSYIFAADGASTYNVVLSGTDAFNTTTKSTTLSTAEVLMHFGADGKSVGVGKVAEFDGLDVGFALLKAVSAIFSGTLTLTRNADASGTANNGPALIVGGAATAEHLELDANELMAKSDGTTPSALYLNNDGGLVRVGSGGLEVLGEATVSSLISQGVRVPQVQHGMVNITPSAANTPTGKAVTFPVKFVGGAPDVVASPATGYPGTLILGVSVLEPSTAGVTIYVTRTTVATTTVRWIAAY